MSGAITSRGMRGRTQEHALRRRDATGGELEMLAKVVNDPNPDPKEVSDYIKKLLQKEHIPARAAYQLLASMPDEPAALRNWARAVFSAVMHEGIHAEAAFPRELFPSSAPTTEDTGNERQ
ncbi:MAG TPA: hypothetical protein VGH84_00620 [Steroidobacteraceae bacterium]|jgi:hypothetical protein